VIPAKILSQSIFVNAVNLKKIVGNAGRVTVLNDVTSDIFLDCLFGVPVELQDELLEDPVLYFTVLDLL